MNAPDTSATSRSTLRRLGRRSNRREALAVALAASVALAGLVVGDRVLPALADLAGADVAEAAGERYTETFDDPSSLDRFDFAIHHAWLATETDQSWTGDHSAQCGPPDPGRTIQNPTKMGKVYYPGMRGGAVYWCNQHLMTAFNSDHYAQVDFSPKRVFTDVSRVCWDQNRTDLGKRQWTQMVIVPESVYQANDQRMDYVAERVADGPGMFGLTVPNNAFLLEFTDGGTITQVGSQTDIDAYDNWTTTDKAKRYTICVTDRRNGTVRIELEHDNGVQVRVQDGSFPLGPARVIFQDDTYNADKEIGVPNSYTWHWDNIVVDTGSSGPPALAPVPPSAAGEFDSLPPVRLLDTRQPFATVDWQYSGGGKLDAGSVTPIQIGGRGRVAADAKAVALNVTAVGADRSGFLTVGPCGASRPSTSSLNYQAGVVAANSVVAQLDGSGRVCIYTRERTHVLVDVGGFFPNGSGIGTMSSARYLDTRAAGTTFDGAGRKGALRAGETVEVSIGGRGAVPSSAAGVVVNLTVAGPQGSGYATAFPCGGKAPVASNLNFVAGETVASGTIVQLGTSGKLCVYSSAATELLVDVNSWMPDRTFSGLEPARVLETRSAAAAITVDGRSQAVGRIRSGGVIEVPVTGRAGVPGQAGAVAVHLTIVNPSSDGYASIYPCGESAPTASTVNYRAGRTVGNDATVRVGSGGRVCIYSLGSADVLLDVSGWFPA